MGDRGRWQPGQSGNPGGRPRGSGTALSRQLREAAEELLPRWIEEARNGDDAKAQFLLDRGLPRMKAISPEVVVDLPAGGREADRLRALFTAVAQGEVPADVAAQMAGIAAVAARTEEMEQLKAELETLRMILKKRREQNG